MAVQEGLPFNRLDTAYINTIPAEDEPTYPGDLHMERKIRALIRYNALAMVMRANQNNDDLGGHLATLHHQRHCMRRDLTILACT